MTPAGAFDTIKITRRVYAGDFDSFLRETNIEEVEWYSPGLGRSVRMQAKRLPRYISVQSKREHERFLCALA